MKRIVTVLLLLLSVSCLSACHASESNLVVTSFYPIEYLVKEMAPAGTVVKNLTVLGGEPHDVTLTVADGKALEQARLIEVLGLGMESWTSSLSRDLTAKTRTAGREITSEAGDVHVWLSVPLMKTLAYAVEEDLIAFFPENEEEITASANALFMRLTTLDEEIRSRADALSTRTLVVTHGAYRYFAEEYGFTQVALSLGDEATVTEWRAVIEKLKADNGRVIYYNVLDGAGLAESAASEVGGVAVVPLDTIESLTSETVNENYESLMRKNMTTLEAWDDDKS